MKQKSIKNLWHPGFSGNQRPETINLNKAGKDIYNFLDDEGVTYNNKQHIEFIVHIDDAVTVNYVIKDPQLVVEYIDFGLCYDSDTFSNFMHDFGFSNLRALKALSPDRLWEMYYKGQAEFFCIFEVKKIYLELYFRLRDNKMIVHDDHNNEYELGEILQTPRQFVEYTQKKVLCEHTHHLANPLIVIYNGNRQV